MRNRDLIVIGASAGGVEALAQLAKDLPAGLPAVILVAVHFPVTERDCLIEESRTDGG
jgi:two-component system chemotaxis response regulator CheB